MQPLDLLGSLAAAQLQTLGNFLHDLLGTIVANRMAKKGLGIFLVGLIEGRAAVEMLPKRAVAIVLQVFETRWLVWHHIQKVAARLQLSHI